MTDQLTALRELVAKVAAGETPITWRAFDADERMLLLIHSAFFGSLDAAKALQEALLPGWVVYRGHWWPTARDPAIYELWHTSENRSGDWCHSYPANPRVEAKSADPARAWLIAILKAKIAELEEADD